MMKPTIETPRLQLFPMGDGDIDFIAKLLSDPKVMRHYPRRYSRSESLLWIDRQKVRYRDDGCGLWLVRLRDSNVPIGQVGLAKRLIDNQVEYEIGYLLHHEFWGKGFATEAGQGTKRFAHHVLRLSSVISLIRPTNLPSRRVAYRLGMSPTATTLFAGLEHTVYRVSQLKNM